MVTLWKTEDGERVWEWLYYGVLCVRENWEELCERVREREWETIEVHADHWSKQTYQTISLSPPASIPGEPSFLIVDRRDPHHLFDFIKLFFFGVSLTLGFFLSWNKVELICVSASVYVLKWNISSKSSSAKCLAPPSLWYVLFNWFPRNIWLFKLLMGKIRLKLIETLKNL